jgi:hypothetical protein
MEQPVNLEELASRYRTWETADLLRATTVEASTFPAEALALLREELERRGNTPAELDAVSGTLAVERERLRGVKGFLALMVLGIGLTSAATLLAAIGAAGRHPLASSSTYALAWAAVGLSGLGTCVLLLRTNPRAPRIAAGWFVLFLVVGLAFSLAGWWLSGQFPWRIALRSLIYPLVWLEYLRVSKRVKVTYSSPRPREPVSTAAFE